MDDTGTHKINYMVNISICKGHALTYKNADDVYIYIIHIYILYLIYICILHTNTYRKLVLVLCSSKGGRTQK